MMRFARISQHRIDQLAGLSAREAAQALRDALGASPAGVRCANCHARFTVLGDLYEAVASDCPDCAGRLELDA